MITAEGCFMYTRAEQRFGGDPGRWITSWVDVAVLVFVAGTVLVMAGKIFRVF